MGKTLEISSLHLNDVPSAYQKRRDAAQMDFATDGPVITEPIEPACELN